jgi:hypothetical protein
MTDCHDGWIDLGSTSRRTLLHVATEGLPANVCPTLSIHALDGGEDGAFTQLLSINLYNGACTAAMDIDATRPHVRFVRWRMARLTDYPRARVRITVVPQGPQQPVT